MMTDPIADMLTRIRNINLVKGEKVSIPFSKIKEGILQVLQKEGYVKGYSLREEEGLVYKILDVTLRYDVDGKPLINKIKRESKPARRVYRGVGEIRKVMNGFGLGIYSTSHGILSDKECRLKQVGGEYLCSIY